MEKRFFLRKIPALFIVFTSLSVTAQVPADSLVMTIGDKEVSLAEFEFIAKKNNGVDLSDQKSLEEYVELFKNFKLKVAEAEESGIANTTSFKEELDTYAKQLLSGYLSDKTAEEKAAEVIYNRGNEYLTVSYILFPFQDKHLAKDTVEVYKKALQTYERIGKGEDFDKVGDELYGEFKQNQDKDPDEAGIFAVYGESPGLLPLRFPKALEEAVYSMKAGEISQPVRTSDGFFLLKVHERKPNPGTVRVVHLLVPLQEDSVTRTKEEAEKLADEIYGEVLSGKDLLSLVKTYSPEGKEGNGLLPPIAPGQVIKEMNDAIFALKSPGEVSKPFLTNFGYHIVQLVERNAREPFDKEKAKIMATMARDDRNFELYRGFDERLKKEYNYTFHPDAYAELEQLSEKYFPGSDEFVAEAESMEKTLVTIGGIDFPQAEFANYLKFNGFSAKKYAGDFMREVYDLFVREIVTALEKPNLSTKYPEIALLIQEYRDGMLLFEISNEKIWEKPVEEQAALEKQWIAELNKKYPVTINWALLKKLKNN